MTRLRESVRGLARSRAGRDGPFVLFLLALLGGSAWFTYRLLSGLDFLELLHLFEDDAFYYFQIARNLATGQFSTFDGGITLTNGYHPVWLFLITPLYWIFDANEALVAIKALEIGLLAGGVALVAVAARLARLPWILLAFVPLALSQHGGLVEGMEAATRVLAYGLLFAALAGYARNPDRWQWTLAAVAFILPWVRLEDVAVSLAATGALFLLELRCLRGRDRGSAWLQKQVASWTSLPAFRPFLAAAASLPVYFAYNSLVFGGPVPVSGAKKQAWSEYVWERDGGYDFIHSFQQTAGFDAFNGELLAALEICAYLLILLWIGRGRADRLATVFLIGAFGLAIGHLATFWHFVLNMHFMELVRSWQFVSGRFMMAILIPIRCYVGICLIRRLFMPKSQRMAVALTSGVILLGLGMQALSNRPRIAATEAAADPKNPLRVVDRISKKNHLRYRQECYLNTQILNKILPDGSLVGSWNSGLIGYYSKFPVINLDGLVNSYDFLDELKSINFGFSHIWQLSSPAYYAKIFSEYGITHFVDLEMPVGVEKGLKRHATLLFEGKVYRKQSFKIFSVEPELDRDEMTEKSDYFFEKMKSHWNYQLGEISVLIDGRVVRVFTKDCKPEKHRNDGLQLLWRGEQAAPMSALWQPWESIRENSLGFCESNYTLPKNAVEPIRVQAMREDTASLLN